MSPMSPETVRLRRPTRLRVVDDVCKSLEEAILSGQMQPGARLVETSIAGQLGVSRTTVREALLMLAQRGLVVTLPRRGAFVTRLSPEDALDLKMARALLEGFAVRLGRDGLDEALADELRGLIEEMRACRLPEDFPRIVQIDLAFHRSLVERAGSSRLLDLWSRLNGQIGALILLGVERRHATLGDFVKLHEDLLAAVRAGDPRALQAAVIDHYMGGQPGAAAPTATATQTIESLVGRADLFGAPPAHPRLRTKER
jgi:DNA-binding GntR family transcriptional regulator